MSAYSLNNHTFSEEFDVMITSNTFTDLSEFISVFAMQAYIIAMVTLVVGGTILDMIHKKSAQYFFENSKTI